MPKKNNIKQNIHIFIIAIFLFVILLIKTDFFYHLYFLSKNNYNQRMINLYGYCEKESYGFLTNLKKIYTFDKNPKILNSKVVPNSDWMIYNSKKNFEKEPNIFLNYQKNPFLVFKYSNNNFKSQGHVQYTDFLDSITFKTNIKNFDINNNVKIFMIKNGEKKIIFEKYINEKIINGESINLSFQTDALNSRWEQLYIEIENFEYKENKIDHITLNLQNKYQFDKDDILYAKDSCFYIR